MKINKQTSILIVVLIVLALGGFLLFKKDLLKDGSTLPERDFSSSLPTLTPPSIEITPSKTTNLSKRAWSVWENYLKFAKAHDLSGVQSLSYQVSSTCKDPSKKKECFALMDSVVGFSMMLKEEMFKNIISDDRQIIMWIDNGEAIVALYFTRDQNGDPKVLGMRFCQDKESISKCVEQDPKKRDQDGNGWWDNVESVFYKN